MNHHIRALVAIVLAGSFLGLIPVQAQTLNPSYLSEMPPPSRILSEIKGKDTEDTIERQMGAFMALNKMIDDMAWGLEHRYLPTRIKPDELRIKDVYGNAYADLWHKAVNKELHKYDHDWDLLGELLNKFFSQSFRDLYSRSNANAAAIYKAYREKNSGVVVGGPAAASSQNTQGPHDEINKPVANNTSAKAAPDAADSYLNEGIKLYKSKEYARSIDSLRRAIQLRPDAPTLATCYNWLASSYRELTQYANAIAALKESLRLRPNNANTTFGLGWTYYLAGQHDNALATLTEAARLDPNEAETQYWIGEVFLVGKKDPDKALTAYRESLRLRPTDARTINQMGLAYSELDQWTEALQAFKEAVRLKPNQGLYQFNLGHSYVMAGMKEQAAAIVPTLQKIDASRATKLSDEIASIFLSDKEDIDSLLIYGVMTLDLGDPASALPVFRRVLLLKPQPEDVASTYRFMGDSYKELNKVTKANAAYQQAVPIYQRLIGLKPRDADLYYGLGHTFLGLGQKDRALQVQGRLATLDKKKAQGLLDEINKSK